jgi:hydroxymethylglutaryl-CoA reductase
MGLFNMEMTERVAALEENLGISLSEILDEGISPALVNRMVENAVGVIGVPLGIATNFVVNGREVLVPMAVEEPSVIAAASNAARMARAGEGFFTESDPPLMMAQIEIRDPKEGARARIEAQKSTILKMANETQSELVSLGGGARDLEVREQVGGEGRLVAHLVVDCLDAMGANIVNTMAEAISGSVAEAAGGRAGLRILTNLADRRLARARCAIPFKALRRGRFKGESVARGVVEASEFASADPYRAATHNKGIFNGIDAVLVATGNDWRAVEAGGHAYAATRDGGYGPLATWRIEEETLLGSMALPMAVGIVGGASRAHPVAKLALEILGVETAAGLGNIVAAVGLAANLAALAALASEGIQFGHMRLHARKQRQ